MAITTTTNPQWVMSEYPGISRARCIINTTGDASGGGIEQHIVCQTTTQTALPGYVWLTKWAMERNDSTSTSIQVIIPYTDWDEFNKGIDNATLYSSGSNTGTWNPQGSQARYGAPAYLGKTINGLTGRIIFSTAANVDTKVYRVRAELVMTTGPSPLLYPPWGTQT